MTRFLWGGVLIAALLSLPVYAQNTRPSIAVMPAPMDEATRGQVPELFDDYVLTAVQDTTRVQVVGPDDISALINFEQQKDLFDCSDASCIADIGGTLGVDKLVVMKVAQLESDWVITSKIINIRETRVEARQNEIVSGGVRQLLQAVPGMVAKLFGEARPPRGDTSTRATTSTREAEAQDHADFPEPIAPASNYLPLRYVRRPLSLPAKTLAGEANMNIAVLDVGFGGPQVGFAMEVGAAYGILDDLTVEARPLGFVVGDSSGFQRFQIGALYRFVGGEAFELGAQFRMAVFGYGNMAFNPGLVARIHAGNSFRLDTGLNFTGAVGFDSGRPLSG